MLTISRPLLFLATIVIAFMMLMMNESDTPQYIRYTTVTGFFLQDDPDTEPKGFDYVSTGLSIYYAVELMGSGSDELRLDSSSL